MAEKNLRPTKEYLGDGAYVEDEGFQLRVFCGRSEGDHEVFLEPDALRNLIEFARRCGWDV